ncbi:MULTISPECIES: hypothetical protein [unclassified Haladaptatus]|uniref:hypothetical protein n=1 Tax=unclassified Haladaptatus TaxID=2622732 RepID=UPI0023E7EF8A|nr:MULTISPECIES: hypothetical protein [unclassified Haladaptatus]
MESTDRTQFTRAIRALSADGFVQFVAALWEARGWDTTVSGVFVTATQSDSRVVIRVVSSTLATAFAPLISDEVDLVVARTPLAVAFLSRTHQTETVVSESALAERFLYGLSGPDREQLWEDHLEAGPLGPSHWERVETTGAALGRVRTSLTGRRARSRLAAFAVVVAVAALVTQAGILSNVPVMGGNQPDSTATGTSISATPVEPAAAAIASDIPSACPPPPTTAHPKTLRPRVVTGASATGLEGWTSDFEMNLTSYDPNDYTSGEAPVVTHVVAYETPANRTYRVDIDRWQSVSRAGQERNQTVQEGDDDILRWGAYTVRVRSLDNASSADADIRELFAAVTSPDGTKLGVVCVDALTDQ